MEKNSAITLRKHKAGQAPEGNDVIGPVQATAISRKETFRTPLSN